MGVDTDDVKSPDTSDIETLDAAEAASASDDAGEVKEGADSSTAQDEGDKDEGLLSVVRSAIDDSRTNDTASPADDENSDDPDGEAASDDTDEDTAEDAAEDDESFSDVPFNKHPRFQKLIAQRNELRGEAEQFRKVQSFLDQNDLNAEEAAEGLTLMALMKHSPAEAWTRLKPHVQKLLAESGELLPQDLTERVRKGEITREAALEMSRLRAKESSRESFQQHQARVAKQQQQRDAQMALRNEAASWETQMRGRDPDFDAKAEALQKEVIWLQRRDGVPTDPAGVRKQLKTAYDAVNKTVKPKREPKPAINPVTGGKVAGTPKAEPKSMLDVVRGARSAG